MFWFFFLFSFFSLSGKMEKKGGNKKEIMNQERKVKPKPKVVFPLKKYQDIPRKYCFPPKFSTKPIKYFSTRLCKQTLKPQQTCQRMRKQLLYIAGDLSTKKPKCCSLYYKVHKHQSLPLWGSTWSSVLLGVTVGV